MAVDPPITTSLEHERIYQAIMSRAKQGQFFKVSYGADDEILVDRGHLVTPESFALNEVGCSMRPSRNRQGRYDEIAAWMWRLILTFPEEVSLELFTQQLLDTPILLARDDGHDRQVTIRCLAYDPRHPVRNSAGQGTSVVFTFEAAPSRL